jgi:hypothetical protein
MWGVEILLRYERLSSFSILLANVPEPLRQGLAFWV